MKARFEELGWGAVSNPEHDLGTDLWLAARDERRFDLGLLVGAQVKTGRSFFRRPKREGGEVVGWWFPDRDQDHFRYWMHHTVPHVLVLHDPSTRDSYWVHVTADAVIWTGKGGKIFVPANQKLEHDSLPGLLDVATSQRAQPRWAGSSWNGAPGLAPRDLLRHALIAPRLVAPHPNAGLRPLEPHEAISVLTSGRFGELDRYGLLDGGKEHAREGWGWGMFSALRDFALGGEIEQLRVCARTAGEPHEIAASTAALAAALVEEGETDNALLAVTAALNLDACEPVDQAWLQLHQARCFAEVGERRQALRTAIEVQRLLRAAPDDATANALAASAAGLVMRVADMSTTNFGALIEAADTEVNWWRAQVTSWGLGAFFDDTFRSWSRDENTTRFSRDAGQYRLRGVSLMAGFAGSHEDWCRAMASLSRWSLMRGGPNQDADNAAVDLTALRRAGDTEGIRAAVIRLLQDGPADAVTQAADLIDLPMATHTDARASLELLRRGQTSSGPRRPILSRLGSSEH